MENAQLAVLATLAKGDYTGIVRTRLFLPEAWTEGSKRLEAADVPKEARRFRTKPELAAEMIATLHAEGVAFDFTNVNALCGNCTAYRYRIDALCSYIVFVHCDQTIYLADTQPSVPERRSEKVPTPSVIKTSAFSQRVDEFAREQPPSAWQCITYHQRTKGGHTREVLTKQVWR
jgi:SRSO17 transposase